MNSFTSGHKGQGPPANQEADAEPGSMGPTLSGRQVAGAPEGSSPAHFLPAPAHQGHPDSAS